jgi:hypothetical protein
MDVEKMMVYDRNNGRMMGGRKNESIERKKKIEKK